MKSEIIGKRDEYAIGWSGADLVLVWCGLLALARPECMHGLVQFLCTVCGEREYKSWDILILHVPKWNRMPLCSRLMSNDDVEISTFWGRILEGLCCSRLFVSGLER